MTDASMQVATIDLRPINTVADNSSANRKSVDNAIEASTTDGKNFADTLRAADERQTEKEVSSKAGSRKTVKSESGKKGEVENRDGKSVSTGRQKNKATGSGKGQNPILKALASEKVSVSDKDDANFSMTRESEAAAEYGIESNHEVQASLAEATLHSGNVSENVGSIRTVKGSDKSNKAKYINSSSKTGTQSAQTDKLTADSLTSKSGRVDVTDKRNLESIDRNQGSTTKTRFKSPESKGRQEITNRTNAATVKTFEAPVAETDIELSPSAGKAGSVKNAAAQLAQKLDGQAGNEIVRQVKVVLTKAQAGEVQINLRPDNLGRVRIRIQMENNRLTGRIFVESAAAREAFKDAIDGLQAKLVESGFGSADLELAWDDSASSFADGRQQSKKDSADTGRSAREFENMVPTTVVDETADGRIDLVV